MEAIQIVDWNKHYENNRTRELKKMQWVPMPIRHDGAGYRQLLDHPNGAAHFGAWCALVEVAASCDARGTLSRNHATPLSEADLSRMTGIPENIWKEVLPRLVSIGWIKEYQNPAGSCDTGPQEGALNGMEWNGKKEGNTKICAVAKATPLNNAGKSSLEPIQFDWTDGTWVGIEDDEFKRWQETYPACDVEGELRKASAWLLADPRRKKTQYRRFLTGWLDRSQQKGGQRPWARK